MHLHPRPLRALAAALACTALAGAAQAHGIWFAQRAGQLALIYGDGAEDLDVVKRLPKLRAIGGLDGRGQAVPAPLEIEGRMAFINLGHRPAVLVATMDNGLWSRDATGKWHGKGKDEVAGAVVSGHYMKYATHLVKPPEAALAPAPGLALQIVPVGLKFPQYLGEPLTVQVFYDGKPLPHAAVWRDVVTDPDGVPLKADAQGRVTLPVRNQGLNVIRVEHESASVDPGKTDRTHHFATLSFMLEHAPE
ncbi:hypothetical protein J2X16_002566 [Pelomonas aquatica]|uniref:DUF4198 domain-containing protein n=1 Tax=Pelomonas aquatica TaxID=431058 RepID=A0ABU1Z9B9_9BURK|nr:DUF4198 domain-containing protein [Pelomonas aquatica]MDR7297219.1 hypothetical protein [Pelomonas aquatica]